MLLAREGSFGGEVRKRKNVKLFRFFALLLGICIKMELALELEFIMIKDSGSYSTKADTNMQVTLRSLQGSSQTPMFTR